MENWACVYCFVMVFITHRTLNAFKWSLLFVAIFVVSHFTSWYVLGISGVSNGGPFFGDLRSVLTSADCAGTPGQSIYSDSCGYIYGSWLIRGVQFIGLGVAHSQILGWIFLVAVGIFLGSLVASLADTQLRTFLLAIMVFTSPPILLLVERSNIDILVIVLLALSALSISRGWIICAIGLVVAASIFKFYPAPLLLWLCISNGKWWHKLVSALSFLFVCFQIIHDLDQMSGDIPQPTFVAFGNKVFGLYFEYYGFSLHPLLTHGAGLLLILICSVTILWLEKRCFLSFARDITILRCRSYVDVVFAVFTLVFFVCFFAGMSYDYRLIFLLVPALLLVSRTKHLHTNTFLTLLLFAASWGSWNYIFQPIGDGAIALWCAVLLRSLYGEIISELLKLKQQVFWRYQNEKVWRCLAAKKSDTFARIIQQRWSF